MTKEIYLDNAATTKPYKEVVDIMTEVLNNNYGNPSSLHTKGLEAERAVKSSRRIIADSLKVNLNEIIFTSGGTEANNLGIIGFVNANKKKGNHLITSKIEHPSVLNTFKHLEEVGYKVSYIDVDSKGILNIEQLQSEINDNTILLSIMHVNNEVGTIQPIDEIKKIIDCKNSNISFHVDAVQSYGKVDFSPMEYDIDLLSLSSHKIHGPKGIGALYVKKGTKLRANSFGGAHESGLRSGTENVPGIIGLGKAVEVTFENFNHSISNIRYLKERLACGIKSLIDDITINCQLEDLSSPHILNVSFKGIKSEVLLHSLEAEGIFVSTGSACASKKSSPSHVLTAIGLDRASVEGAVRFSLSSFNNEQDIDICIEKLDTIVNTLRKFKRR